jgi:hypothetical protein
MEQVAAVDLRPLGHGDFRTGERVYAGVEDRARLSVREDPGDMVAVAVKGATHHEVEEIMAMLVVTERAIAGRLDAGVRQRDFREQLG